MAARRTVTQETLDLARIIRRFLNAFGEGKCPGETVTIDGRTFAVEITRALHLPMVVIIPIDG